jgi:hypothetical protein
MILKQGLWIPALASLDRNDVERPIESPAPRMANTACGGGMATNLLKNRYVKGNQAEFAPLQGPEMSQGANDVRRSD